MVLLDHRPVACRHCAYSVDPKDLHSVSVPTLGIGKANFLRLTSQTSSCMEIGWTIWYGYVTMFIGVFVSGIDVNSVQYPRSSFYAYTVADVCYEISVGPL
jgi:hypothetical protein